MADLKEKQKRFADYYISSLDIADSYIQAGYKASTTKSAYTKGWSLLKNPAVKEYVDKRLKEIDEKRIMKTDEILTIYTTIARSEEVAIKDKLKALDALGKINGLFVEKVQTETTYKIVLPDFTQLQNPKEPEKLIEPVDVEYEEEDEKE